MTDYLAELNKEIAEINALAFDQGVELAFERIITLCEISGGRLTTKQLKEFKKYLDAQIVEQNERRRSATQTEQQEADEAVRPRFELVNTEVVEFSGSREAVGQDVPTEAAEPQEEPGSEAVTQAESS